ncbi:hypothetical protein C8T65DRAFT_746004 [Cerioporus squamosus]|nr:hypothetical protein C8T65DRAFT_746004 [Cerioporus squamosus]
MSSQAEIAAIVAEANSITISGYCAIASIGTSATVLYIYEYLINFHEEVTCFWRAKLTGATVLFFLTRHGKISKSSGQSSMLTDVAQRLRLPSQSCVFPDQLDDFIETMQYLPWAGFAALRAYALSRNRPVSVLVFVLSSVTIVLDMLDRFKYIKPAVLPIFGCSLTDTVSPHLAIGTPPLDSDRTLMPIAKRDAPSVSILARASLIVADAILIVVTWMKLSRRGGATESSFVHVVLRDGTIYFICLLILNTLHLSFTVASIATPVFSLRPVSNVIVFSEPLTAILISRFMLNLQSVNRKALQLEPRRDLEPRRPRTRAAIRLSSSALLAHWDLRF